MASAISECCYRRWGASDMSGSRKEGSLRRVNTLRGFCSPLRTPPADRFRQVLFLGARGQIGVSAPRLGEQICMEAFPPVASSIHGGKGERLLIGARASA